MIDYKKTGSFIAQMRKNRGLTQRQLAELLNLSDKTISKWETGRSSPDNSIMLELCTILNISVNELLSGERISEDVYISRAEENLVELIKEGEERDKKERWTKIGTILGFLLMIVMIYVVLFRLTEGYKHIAWFLDPASFCYLIGITVLVLLASGMLPDFIRAFFISYGKKTAVSIQEAGQALTAVKTALATLLFSGVLSFTAGFLALSDPPVNAKTLLPNMGSASLTVFYGILLALLLLPTAARTKRTLLNMH